MNDEELAFSSGTTLLNLIKIKQLSQISCFSKFLKINFQKSHIDHFENLPHFFN